jgi:hypothetical protein
LTRKTATQSIDESGRLLELSYAIRRNNGYQARVEIDGILKSITDPKRLEPFGFKVYSQNDEDGILEEIFKRLGVTKGNFCEIGVSDGLECNSLYLIHKGWRGIWIEGDLVNRPKIEAKFQSIIPSRLTPIFAMMNTGNLNEAFSALKMPEHPIDLVSIDIDGNDIYLLEVMELRPKVICIEYNAKWPPSLSKQPPYNPAVFWNQRDYMGSSLRAIWEVARKKDYRLVATNITGANAFFVRDDLCADLFPDDASPEALYNPPRYWLWNDHFDNIGHPPDFGPYVDLMEP